MQVIEIAENVFANNLEKYAWNEKDLQIWIFDNTKIVIAWKNDKKN